MDTTRGFPRESVRDAYADVADSLYWDHRLVGLTHDLYCVLPDMMRDEVLPLLGDVEVDLVGDGHRDTLFAHVSGRTGTVAAADAVACLDGVVAQARRTRR